jgi:hypothetical protein
MVFSKELHEQLVKMGKIVYNNREVNVVDGDETEDRVDEGGWGMEARM